MKPIQYTLIFFLLGNGLQLWGQCDFQLDPITPCAGQLVTAEVVNPDPNATYEWDFTSDGTIDEEGPIVSFSYPVQHQDSTYTVTLLENGIPCSSQSITSLAAPDPTIGVPPGIVSLQGNEIKACNGDNSITLEIFNASSTYADNASYTINWGDGSPNETFDNTTFSNTNLISHTYNSLGYFTLFITVTHTNGCMLTNTYTFYNGGNPSVGISIPGNTVGLCAPATLEFPITNTDNNPPGTEYTVFINGEAVTTFSQDSVPPSFSYTFLESSCGNTTTTGNYEHAFDVRIVASNPCNSSTATIEPIEVSEPPMPDFSFNQDVGNCPGSIVTFENTTPPISEVVSGNPSSCVDLLNPSWSILQGVPGQDWELISGSLFGSNELEIQFNTPGVYTVEMTVVSFACGEFTFSQDIVIAEPPMPQGSISLPTAGGPDSTACVPFTLPFENQSQGEGLSYNWTISPSTGWSFQDSTTADSLAPIVEFTEGGIYTISLTAANSCAEVTWDTTLVLPGPPEVALDPLPDFCYQAELNLDDFVNYQFNGDSIFQYTWQLPGGQPSTDSTAFPGTISYGSPGTYGVEVFIENGCGTAAAADSFMIQEPVALTLPPPASFCLNDPALLLEAAPGGGEWTGAGIDATGMFHPIQAGVGTHTLTYSFGIGACETVAQLEVEVLPLPSAEAGPPQALCLNDPPIQLSGQPGDGNWLINNQTYPNPITLTPQDLGPLDQMIYYERTDSLGCTGRDSTNMVVYDLPEVVTTDTIYCDLPGDVSLPVAEPPGGIWNGPGVSDPTGTFDPSQAGTDPPFTLLYSATDANGCSDTATAWVDLVPVPVVNAGPDRTYCLSDPGIYLTGQSPLGGTWSGPGIVNNTTGFWQPSNAGPGTHTLTYSLANSGCEVEDQIVITVLPPPAVDLPTAPVVCHQSPVFTLPPASPNSGSWSGPGLSGANAFDPSVLPGDYPLVYTVTDNQGCQGSETLTVTVLPLPTLQFSIPNLTCTNNTFTIDNQSNNNYQFNWNFNNQGSSTAYAPTYAFAAPGFYAIELTGTDNAGCAATLTQEIQVEGPPQADFSMSVEDGCGPLSMDFSNQSQAYAPSYLWDFGNGNISTASIPNQTQVYLPGLEDTTYVIQLWVENLCGTDFLSDTLTVYPLPVADFGIAIDTGCAPVAVSFTNTSSGSPTSYQWDFGNGTTSDDILPNPQLYLGDTIPVTYPVQLIATNSCGSDTLHHPLTIEPEEVSAFINLSNTQGCQPFTIDLQSYTTPGTQVSWNFGDGTTGNGNTPVHTFTEAGQFPVTLYAANSCTADSSTVWVEVLEAPYVNFDLPSLGCSNAPVSFQNLSSPGSSFEWILSTGDTLTELDPQYLFPDPGTFSITLNATTNTTGCSASTTQDLSIFAPPQVSIDINDPDGCIPHTSQFAATGTSNTYYQWDYGDGNTAVGASAIHTYEMAGTYYVQLIGTDGNGCQDTATFTPIQAYPLPVADFIPEKDQQCGLPQVVSFENLSSGAQGYQWTLGPDIETNLTSPVYSYPEAGPTTIQLIAQNTFGCVDTSTQQIHIYAQPQVDFELPSEEGCTPLTVNFVNLTQDATHFLWQFGDGRTSTEENPQITYAEAGDYPVSLIASYEEVCFDTLEVGSVVSAYPTPVASFTWIEDPAGEPTGSIQFLNESTDAWDFIWDLGDGTTTQEENPIHRYTDAGDRQVRLEVSGAFGCADDTIAVLRPPHFGRLWVPNALTPDRGPGETMVFSPKGVGLKEYHVQVFSTYGQLIWESKELTDGQPAEGWDGTFNGKPLAQDTYVWRIWAIFEDGREWQGVEKGGRYKRTGAVVLIR
jgi:PKD repeat protein